MSLVASLFMLQTGVSAKQPSYFATVLLGSLVLGGVGWLVAAVMGFARARAFGPSARWFSFAAVCLLIYHIQFLLLGFVAVMGAQQNDFDSVLSFGAFFNLFVIIGAFCAIMGFVRLTNPR
jgi:cation transporter-like permease